MRSRAASHLSLTRVVIHAERRILGLDWGHAQGEQGLEEPEDCQPAAPGHGWRLRGEEEVQAIKCSVFETT